MLKKRTLYRIARVLILAAIMTFGFTSVAFAQDEGPTVAELAYAIDNLVLFGAAVLVIFMQAGFAMVEAGFNEGKNTVNILFKNLIDLSLGIVLYFIIGYSLMYGNAVIPGVLGFGGFGIGGTAVDAAAAGALNPQVDWLFQVAFAATAATIVSGAVAGRMKFQSYLIYTVLLTGLIYPISGFWKWGGGWLDALGFYDFAGSLVVHAVGGFAGLAGAIVLGARTGRFNEDGTANEMPPSNYSIAMLGVIILFVGWFGFNPGSQLAFTGTANTDATVLIAVNTTLAAGIGAVMAMAASWIMLGKPKLGFALNGMLGGLVGITANCDSVTNLEALAIGGVAGVLVVAAMIGLEKLKIDDPVGAFPVHGVCGVWGGIATGIFGGYNLGVQILGSLAYPAWAFVTMFALFTFLKATGNLRVSAAEEAEGLDAGEHGELAYAS
jgi:Amt family ammonium transporter